MPSEDFRTGAFPSPREEMINADPFVPPVPLVQEEPPLTDIQVAIADNKPHPIRSEDEVPPVV